ncbi:MAG: sulfotransferase domain-containing protein [Anaerolineae bacterium]|nr:sulfotransferase domain-containing protein [Anaerolineae bacterium]
MTDQSPVLPNAMILGAPKSGTTWLYDNLRGHPQIATPREEIHYFNYHLDRGLDWYQQFFAEVYQGEPIILDAGSSYLYIYDHLAAYFEYQRDIPGMIKDVLGNPKMILIFRDPVDRLLSNYTNLMQGVVQYGGVYRGDARHYSVQEAKPWAFKFKATWIGDYEKQVLNFLVPDTLEKTLLTHPALIERGFYDVHLRRYLDVFPPENFLYLEMQMLRQSPIDVMHRICEFLGIEHWYDEDLVHARSNTAETRALPRSWYWQSWFAKQARKGRLPWLMRRLMTANERLGQKPQLSDDLANVLARWYEPHNRELAQITGLDLSHWRSPR